MDNCPRCGEALGPAARRYCINCGQRIDGADPVAEYADWRTDTSERSVVPMPDDHLRAATGALTDSAPAVAPPADPDRPHRAEGPAHRPPIGWVAALVGMVLVGLLGAWLLFGGTSGDPAPVAEESPQAPASSIVPSAPKPSASPTKTKPTKTPAAEPVDVTRQVEVSAPKTAADSTDASGRTVSYDAEQMLDGVPETCWRMPGDGTDGTIVFTLPQQTEITELGLINGYAKTAKDARGRLDWYHGNRRIQQVTWTFDDGTEISQELADTTSMQTVEVDHVLTGTVKMTLDQVSGPGTGRAARNYTAISDVSLVGALG